MWGVIAPECPARLRAWGCEQYAWRRSGPFSFHAQARRESDCWDVLYTLGT